MSSVMAETTALRLLKVKGTFIFFEFYKLFLNQHQIQKKRMYIKLSHDNYNSKIKKPHTSLPTFAAERCQGT